MPSFHFPLLYLLIAISWLSIAMFTYLFPLAAEFSQCSTRPFLNLCINQASNLTPFGLGLFLGGGEFSTNIILKSPSI